MSRELRRSLEAEREEHAHAEREVGAANSVARQGSQTSGGDSKVGTWPDLFHISTAYINIYIYIHRFYLQIALSIRVNISKHP